jgi:hypothetical protein
MAAARLSLPYRGGMKIYGRGVDPASGICQESKHPISLGETVMKPLRESFPRLDAGRRRQAMADVALRILLALFPREAGMLRFEALIGRTR